MGYTTDIFRAERSRFGLKERGLPRREAATGREEEAATGRGLPRREAAWLHVVLLGLAKERGCYIAVAAQ